MIENWISRLENTPMTFASWLAAFLGIVWIRYLLESFSSPNVTGFIPSDFSTILHYTLYYLAAVTLTVVLVTLFTRIDPLRAMRALIFVLPIMWLGPLVDLTHGGMNHISYVFVSSWSAIVQGFFTYFGPLTGVGATFGLRVELGLLILMLGGYVYVHTRSGVKAFLGALAVYIVVYATAVLPSVLGLLVNGGLFTSLQSSLIARTFLHPAEAYSIYRTSELFFNASMAQILYLILCIAGGAWFWFIRKDIVRALVKNLRPERLGHFIVMAILGALIAIAEGSRVTWTLVNIFTLLVAFATIVFTCVIAIITNDLIDVPIDEVSNQDRPLVTGTLTPREMKDAALICTIMAILGALSLGSYSFFFIALFSAAYYVYSVPPLRLKRIPLFSSALIGVASLSMMLFGFFLISMNQELGSFPGQIALLVVIFMAFITNVRDLKDIQGDERAGIWTLPTLLGATLARQTMALLTVAAYLLVPMFIPISVLWIPSIVAATVSAIVFLRGGGEKIIFIIYYLYLISIVTLLIVV